MNVTSSVTPAGVRVPIMIAGYRREVVDGHHPPLAQRGVSSCAPMASPDVQPTYVRLPSDLHAAVKERSVAEERTMAQTIRLALRYYLQETSAVVAPPSPA